MSPRLPIPGYGRARRRLARVLAASSVLIVLLSAGPPATVQAWWTPRAPVGNYSPRHVWQLHDACVWAAGQMLMDKWTHGALRVSAARLRYAARDRTGGSTLVDLARGVYRSTGIRLYTSPGFGDSMTWWQLLDRLEHDGGAVLMGEYSRLPDHFTRWQPRFARLGYSGHAVYVERYDRANARVWLMDPLAEGSYAGEWIDVDALRRFAFFQGDLVMAAATPARHTPSTAPLGDRAYHLSGLKLPQVEIAGTGAPVQVDLSIGAGFPKPAAYQFVATWEPIIDPIDASSRPAISVDNRTLLGATVSTATLTTASGAVGPGATGFSANLPVPPTPGRYRVTVGLALPGATQPARTLPPVEVDVHGQFAAAWTVPPTLAVEARAQFALPVDLKNIGTVDWGQAPATTDGPMPVGGAPSTRLIASWLSSDGRTLPGAEVPSELLPGGTAHVVVTLTAPIEPGSWILQLDLANAQYGSLTDTGWPGPTVAVTVQPTGTVAGQ